ncbi:MauE/DoxX family redox-associated membrane protein, partial [Flavobacterium sp.]
MTSKNNIAWGIRIVISFLFLLSAVAKLYPSPYFAISTFEVKQLYPMGFSEGFAPYFSRILIGIELALGVLLLQKNFLRSIVIPGTILLLAVFTTHLTIDSFMNGGNSGNCGCFGSLLPMTPIEAIIKNVVAMILLVWLFIILPKTNEKKNNFWVLSTVTFA